MGGHKEWRGEQKRAVYSCLFGKFPSTVFIAAAGSGKSFVYEAAARINRDKLGRAQTCLIIGPLRAIIADQVAHFKKANMKALDWTKASAKHSSSVSDKLRRGGYDFGALTQRIPF